MTREEAIKRIKAWDLDSDDREVLEVIIPELRESEDERIRKELIKVVSDIAGDWPFEKHEITKKEALAYLEKQKESLHIQETCEENANSFADGIIEVRSFQRGMEEGRRLERQKEQKLNIELIQRSWYMEGYRDREFGKEPKWIIKTGEGGPKHELNPKYGQPLTKQQVTKEQLHNLNEAIKSFRMDGFNRIADSLHSLYNILNTQGVEPAERKATINGKPISTENKSVDIPLAEWSEEDKKMLDLVISNYKYMTRKLRKGDGSDDVAGDIEVFSWLESLPERFNFMSKQEYESHPIISEDTTSVKPRELDGKALLYTADKSYQIGFRDGVASVKPAEWSEEDEKMIERIVETIQDYAMETGQIDEETGGTKEPLISYINFLRSLRPSWKPSEEQMKALDKARRFIPYNCDALESLYNDLKKLT